MLSKAPNRIVRTRAGANGVRVAIVAIIGC